MAVPLDDDITFVFFFSCPQLLVVAAVLFCCCGEKPENLLTPLPTFCIVIGGYLCLQNQRLIARYVGTCLAVMSYASHPSSLKIGWRKVSGLSVRQKLFGISYKLRALR